MEKAIDRNVQELRQSLAEKEERIKRLVGENITLITENMKLAYDVRNLRKRNEFLELCDKGYSLRGAVKNKGDYMVMLIKIGEFSREN